MCNMCRHLTTKPRQNGTILAKCAIRTANPKSQDSQEIMAAYKKMSKKSAMANEECQFYYEIQKRQKEDPDFDFIKFIQECPGRNKQ